MGAEIDTGALLNWQITELHSLMRHLNNAAFLYGTNG